MAKRAPFKRGDLVQYCASLDPTDTNFIEMYSKHETSIGIVESATDPTNIKIAWISHNFPTWTDVHTDWSAQVLKKIGHIKLDKAVPDAKGKV